MAWVNGVEVPDAESGASLFYESLSPKLLDYWEEAEVQVLQPDYEHPVVTVDEFGVCTIEPGLMCPHTRATYSTLPPITCKNAAGRWTAHEGVGFCASHGGTRGRPQTQGAVFTAMAFADELNVSPWEALLSQVRLLANQVRWLRMRVENAEAEHGVDGIRPGGEGWDWVAMLEARGDRLAKVSKMAIDAGVAERLVRQLELEADHMAAAAIATFERLGIYGEQRDEALEFMGAELMRLEAGEHVPA